MPEPKLTRQEIAEILDRNKGSKAELSRRAEVMPSAVSMWLAGGPNSNLDRAGAIYAAELLAKEEAERLTAGEANGPSARRVIEAVRSGDPLASKIVDELTQKAPKTEE